VDETTARQFHSISHNPPVLQIQVQRVQFDKAKNTPYKADSHLALEKVIFLDRYMDSDDPVLMSKREKSWQLKEELMKLEWRKRELMQTEARWLLFFSLFFSYCFFPGYYFHRELI
jgi:ubiquitin carboxyl-terminal hydrolase 25/28